MVGDSLNLHELNNGVASPTLDPFFPEDGQEQQCRPSTEHLNRGASEQQMATKQPGSNLCLDLG